MTVFGLLLKSIFLVALMIAVFIIGVVIYLYMRVRHVARTFSAMGGQGASRQHAQHGNGASGGNGSAGPGNAHKSQQSQGNGSAGASFVDEELYDERSPRERNRKIFHKDEGEYVDFVEE